MDSATKAKLLAAMTAGPVTAVTGQDSTAVTAEARTNPPVVTAVTVLPPKQDNSPDFDPREGESWPAPDRQSEEHTHTEGKAGDYSISAVTPVTRSQMAESCGSPLLPDEKSAGNAGNSPEAEPLTLWRFAGDGGDVLEWAELAHGGRVVLTETGCAWSGPRPPAELLALLRDRKDDIRAWLLESEAARRDRRRRASTWNQADWLAYFQERAAMRSADPRQPDAEADRLALEDCKAHWLALNCPPPGEPENGCWQCRRLGHAEADPLIERVCRGGVFWLHPRCWADFDRGSEAATAEAMKAIMESLS